MTSTNLSDLFVGMADRWRDRPAIESPFLTLTYGGLIERAARSARELRERGVRPGAKVGIATRENAEIIVLLIAVWMLGATAVPIDFRSKPGERKRLSQEFEILTIVEDRQKADAGYTSILADESWADVIGRHSAQALFDDREEFPALLSLTSGTTGAPNGIIIDHNTLLYRMIFKFGVLREGGRFFNIVPLSLAGPRNPSLGQLFLGGTVILHPPMFNAKEYDDAIRATNATAVYSVPTIVRDLLKLHEGSSEPVFGNLYSLVCYGAPLLPEEKKEARRRLTRNFVEGYSSSIAGGITLLQGDDIDNRPETVGRVMPHVTMQIVDDDDNPLPPGEAGNIRARAPTMARGVYRQDPDSDRDRIKNGWAYPGDIGVVDEQGFLTLLGRASDVIIRGGVNVHPSEIEAALANCPGVREVAVAGVLSERQGEEIAAFVVAEPGLTEAAITQFARASLSPDRLPRIFQFVTEIPRNAGGKVLRTALRQAYSDNDKA